MSILDGVAHSEKPELGWAGAFHSSVASLKHICYSKSEPKSRQNLSSTAKGEKYQNFEIVGGTSEKSPSAPAAASMGSPCLMTTSTNSGHRSSPVLAQKSPERISTIASRVSVASSWSISA